MCQTLLFAGVMNTREPTDDLLGKANAGDQDALTDLLHRHGAEVRSNVAGMIAKTWRSIISAEDVMQVTYLEVFLGISTRMPRSVDEFRNWLATIAKNNLRDAIRELEAAKRPSPALRIRPPDGGDSVIALYDLVGGTYSTPSRIAARNEAKTAIAEALSQIPDDYRRVIQLYDLDGRPVNEVASAMQRSTGAVFMLRSRALERLREILAGGPKLLSETA